MTARLRRLYAPEYMVPSSQRLGEFPAAREAYISAAGVTLPSMSESFLVAMVTMVDTIMVGRVGVGAIAAVALCTQPRFIIITLVLALNMAVTSVVARRKGEGDPDSARRCMCQSILLSLGISLLTSGLAALFLRDIIWFAGAQPDTIDMAAEYFWFLLLGTPVCCVSLTICAAQRGAGATGIAMKVNITANLVNIVFNYLLIEGRFGFPRLETRGAAIATVMGWTVGLFMALFSVASKDGFLTLRTKKGWRFDRRTLKALYQVASGAFVEQIFQRIGFLSYNVLVAKLGTVMLAANAIGMQVMSLSFSLGDGLGIGTASLVGQSLGKKRPDLAVMYTKVSIRIASAICSILFILFVTRSRWIYSLFTDDPEIILIGETIMVIASIITMGQAIQLVYIGMLRGAGDTGYTAVISMICIMVVRPGLAWLLAYPLGMGLIGAWISFMIDLSLRLILSYIRFRSGKWARIKL